MELMNQDATVTKTASEANHVNSGSTYVAEVGPDREIWDLVCTRRVLISKRFYSRAYINGVWKSVHKSNSALESVIYYIEARIIYLRGGDRNQYRGVLVS